MEKYFNIAGPCNPQKHYMIEASARLSQLMPLIDQEQYFVIHAARQSGKTTLLLDLVNKLNASGKYHALYCSLEVIQGITDAKDGIPAAVNAIKLAVKNWQLPFFESFAKSIDLSDYANVLFQSLSDYCRLLDKPLVIFFDEADCLSEQTLITFLRQLRNGYNTRSHSPFIHSLALVGMRNIRDFKAKIRPDSDTLGSASPFNIVTESLTLNNFTELEIASLYKQHTLQTRQEFSNAVVELVHKQTNGQPWLVNAIARECITKILESDYTRTIAEDHVKQSIQNIILRRDTHIDSLLERLKEPRVRKVIEPIILGKSNEISMFDDNTLYCLDLGLIKVLDGELLPSNLIYNEIIIRALSFDSQFYLIKKIQPVWILSTGIIDMTGLLQGFQQFWRENSSVWVEKYDYKEAAPHLILQAFLQRVINGGGSILREYASGRERIDLCVIYGEKKYPIELKMIYSKNTIDQGIEQLGQYMDTLGETTGWLVVFDRSDKAWDEKIYWKTQVVSNSTIHVVGC